MVWRSRHGWAASLVAAVAVLSLVAAACDAEGGETGAGEQVGATGGQVGATDEPAATTFVGEDYLLDLETGETTPLPESIAGQGYAISPDGSEVAYYGPAEDGSRQLEVFVAHLDGTQVRQITHGGVAWQPTGSPGWSSDGTKIAYVGRPKPGIKKNIFVIDLTSGMTTQVTFETVHVSSAQFSPDGSSIVYSAPVPDGSEVRIVPATGGTGSRLVGGDRSSASGASLSPDGSLLSYLCTEEGEGYSELCLANADGSQPRVIAEPHGSRAYGIASASWSPDGSRLAYYMFGLPTEVGLIDVATGVETVLVRGTPPSDWPAWPEWVDDHTLIVEIYSGPR